MIFNSIQERYFFYNIPSIFFCFLPFFLITGPLLSDFVVSIITLSYLAYCLKKKNFSEFKKKYFYFFLLFWCYLILNSLVVNINYDSIKISLFFFRYGVFVIAITAYLNFDDSFLKFFYYCIFFCFLILIIDGYFQYFDAGGENIFGFLSGSHGRVSSFFGNELILGSYLTKLWPLFFALSIIFLKKRDIQFFIMIAIFILSEVLIFLSGERVAFFFINFTAVFIIFFSNKLYKLRFITLAISMLIIISISYFSPTAKERIIDKTLSQLNLSSVNFNNQENIKKNNKIYIFSDEHNQHYISAYKMFLDNKVMGVGVKNFRNFCGTEKYKSDKSCSTHPHNIYIQILTETGIIGFLFIMFVFFYFIYFIIKHLIYKMNNKFLFTDFQICLLSGILIFIWPLVPTGNIFNNWLTIIMIIYIPLLIWSKTKLNIDKPNRNINEDL